MTIRGKIKKSRKTKHLINKLTSNDIALICHKDIDEIAAISLVESGIKVIMNAETSSTGKYPNPGPHVLKKAGITLFDNVGVNVFEKLDNGDFIEIIDGRIFKDGLCIGYGSELTTEKVKAIYDKACANLPGLLHDFISNTLEYAKKESHLILNDIDLPKIDTEIKDKHVVVVVRGKNYRQDLRAIASYIQEVKPVLIGVDGGADALLDYGYTPRIIIGDMDSVSNKALKCGAELIIHGYVDGSAPGLSRLSALGLKGVTFCVPGMSEDVALLLAYEKGARLIVLVGSHSSMIDFLEKGRKGMASTFLVRTKIGSILVDARGVSTLYKGQPNYAYLTQIAMGALLPLLGIVLVSESIQQLFRLLALRLRIIFGY